MFTENRVPQFSQAPSGAAWSDILHQGAEIFNHRCTLMGTDSNRKEFFTGAHGRVRGMIVRGMFGTGMGISYRS